MGLLNLIFTNVKEEQTELGFAVQYSTVGGEICDRFSVVCE